MSELTDEISRALWKMIFLGVGIGLVIGFCFAWWVK